MICSDGVGKKSSGFRWQSLMGAPRRFLWNVFRPKYVERQLASRSGACRRCGACCKLVVKCPYFTEDNGQPACKVYAKFRFSNCTKFPIDRFDLAERDRVYPHLPCGYSWEKLAP
jgi:uncharacterized protein